MAATQPNAWLDHPSHAECRALTGHRWYQMGHREWDGKGIGVSHRCSECKTIRHSTWNVWSGELLHRSYDYPENYTSPTGKQGRRLTPTKARALYFRRLFKNRRK